MQDPETFEKNWQQNLKQAIGYMATYPYPTISTNQELFNFIVAAMPRFYATKLYPELTIKYGILCKC